MKLVLKQIPCTESDIDKCRPRDAFKHLVSDLEAFATAKPHINTEHGAKMLGYSNAHDMRSQAGKSPFPAPGSISRLSLQISVAIHLRQMTGESFLESLARAQHPKLQILSIDSYTREASGTLTGPTRDQAVRLIKAGAPAFKIAVARNGMVFDFDRACSLMQAVRMALNLPHLDPKLKAEIAAAQDLDTFLSETLIPFCWKPLESAVKQGLEVPDYEILWLFDGEGSYVGRLFRNTVHGGVIPTLQLTDSDVIQSKISMLLGGEPQHNSEAYDLMCVGSHHHPDSAGEPLYTLRKGARRPGVINEAFSDRKVAKHFLEPLGGITVLADEFFGGGKVKRISHILGKTVSRTQEARGTYGVRFLQTTSWLDKQDLPLLFPNYTQPVINRFRDAFSDQHVLLPSDAVEFQARTTELQKSLRSSAENRIAVATRDGSLVTRLLSVLPPRVLDIAAAHIEHAHTRLPAGVSEEARTLKAKHPALESLDDRLVVYAARACETAVQGSSVEFTAEQYLVQVILLVSRAEQAQSEFFSDEYASIPVIQWLAGLLEIGEVHAQAKEYARYGDLLKAQQQRMDRIAGYLALTKEYSNVAWANGFKFVDSPVDVLELATESDAIG